MVRNGGKLDVPASTVGTWVEFARSMAPTMALPAQLVASIIGQPERELKVLDIAAGHGLFGVRIAQRNPGAAIYALDSATCSISRQRTLNAPESRIAFTAFRVMSSKSALAMATI